MKILEIVTSVSFLFSIIRMTTPILYASMSYLVADLAGVTNIGIEGMVLWPVQRLEEMRSLALRQLFLSVHCSKP